jgi:WD40 repeat protein
LKAKRLPGALLAHGQDVISADTSPDGRWLLTLAQDRAVRLWSLPVINSAHRGPLRARACEALDPEARSLRVEDVRAAPIIEPARIGEGLCGGR